MMDEEFVKIRQGTDPIDTEEPDGRPNWIS